MLVNILNSNVSIVPSIHRLTQNHHLDKSITDKVAQADGVLFERDLDQSLQPPPRTSLMFSVAQSGQVPGNLSGLWSGSAIGRNISELQNLTFAEIADVVDCGIAQNTFLVHQKYGVDLRLWNQVPPAKRGAIQQAADLLAAMAPYPDLEQVAELSYVCDVAKRKSDFRAELDAWSRGDVVELGQLLDTIYLRTPTRANEVLFKRNHIMLQAIMNKLSDSEHAYVFVVGAAHVVGTHGLLNMLVATGLQYQVV